jgi:hypothetical protein
MEIVGLMSEIAALPLLVRIRTPFVDVPELQKL